MLCIIIIIIIIIMTLFCCNTAEYVNRCCNTFCWHIQFSIRKTTTDKSVISIAGNKQWIEQDFTGAFYRLRELFLFCLFGTGSSAFKGQTNRISVITAEIGLLYLAGGHNGVHTMVRSLFKISSSCLAWLTQRILETLYASCFLFYW